MEYLKRHRKIYHIVIIPLLIFLSLPLVLLDICVEIYHRISFPLYGFKCVKRCRYIRIDRHKLNYLNWPQKLYCAYCGYANGLAAYWVKIAGETERYWCGIQHQEGGGFIVQEHQKDFARFNDKSDFERKYKI